MLNTKAVNQCIVSTKYTLIIENPSFRELDNILADF